MICCILALASVSLPCATDATSLVPVTEMDDRRVIENGSTARRVALITSSDGGQQFEIAVGEGVSVSETVTLSKFHDLARSPTGPRIKVFLGQQPTVFRINFCAFIHRY